MSIVDILAALRDSPTEKFAVFYHTAKGIYGHILAEGDHETVRFDAAHIVKHAQAVHASAVSVAHNHPTGEVRPSIPDLDATFAMQDIFKTVNLTLQDHIIVGPAGEPFSMRKEGVL